MWDLIWQALAKGDPTEGFVSSIESEIAKLQLGKHGTQPEVATAIIQANRYHQFMKIQLRESIRQKESRVENIRRLIDTSTRAIEDLNIHLFKSLLIAHGATTLGTLAYLGNKSNTPIGWEFPTIVCICGVGFLFSLLSARLAIVANVRTQLAMMPLTEIFLPDDKVDQAWKSVSEIGNRKIRYDWPTYVSVFLLVGAMTVATIGLWPDQFRSDELSESHSNTPHIVPIAP